MGLSCAWRCKSYVLLNLTFLATWLCFQVLAVSRTQTLSLPAPRSRNVVWPWEVGG